MEIVYEKKQLKNFVQEAFKAAEKNPILIDKFIDHAMEVDVDAISDGEEVFVAGIESDMYSSIWRMKFFLCSLIV